ncbi:hypothetical protein CK203_111083 [Vitis vinifera]|uniref:Uncharacterized protein n=1 Tax=Vitis vinifera TaxID=29760 RepID=A0A438DPU5_VITVI|nr:hypothetical protein CK203_111083 [Vitis vinifera]
MTTLHGSTPSSSRRVEGCIPSEDFIPTRGCICGPSELSWSRLGLVIPSVVSFWCDQRWISQISQIRDQIRSVRSRSDQISQIRDQIRGIWTQIVTVDQFAAAMASIQEAIANLGQRIDGQQTQQSDRGCPTFCYIAYPDFKDPHTRMDRLEQKLRQIRASDGVTTWEDFDGTPVASLPAKFRMPEIERYTA